MSTSAEGKRTALVIGANSGLGNAITAALAVEEMRVGLVVRDRVRGAAALKAGRGPGAATVATNSLVTLLGAPVKIIGAVAQ